MIKALAHTIQQPSFKKGLLLFWALLIAVAIGCYFFFPNHFTAEGIAIFLKKYNQQALIIYLLISVIRGLFLIPSTPFVLAGALLFPDQLFIVFLISIIGILGSGTFIYHAANFLRFSENQSKKINQLNKKINRYGFWIVLVWAFFPAVPTDLICYVAGKTKMNFIKYIFALFIGEAILICIYLYFSQYF